MKSRLLFLSLSMLLAIPLLAQVYPEDSVPDTAAKAQEQEPAARSRPELKVFTNAQTTNYIQKFAGSSTLTDSMISEVGGKIAVSPTPLTPTEFFHISLTADAPSLLLFENLSNTLSANAAIRAKSDTATTTIISHAGNRDIVRYGQDLGGFSELLSFQANGMVIGTNNATPLILGTSNTNRIHITSDGKIGMGTPAPTNALHISIADGVLNVPLKLETTGADSMTGLSLKNDARNWHIRVDGGDGDKLKFYEATAGYVMAIDPATGNVGIGTTSPSAAYKLHVNGNAHFQGEVTGTLIRAHYQDVAEWVPASQDMAAGTVVVLNPEQSNEVMPSHQAYDTTVAGVVSEQPGVLLGEAAPTKEQIATTGRVKVRVDASRGAIRIGDLLVTSDVPGTAMRSEPMEIQGRRFHQPGTIIGKALEPLKSGTNEILVLLSLQ
jgi:hypothetical protein